MIRLYGLFLVLEILLVLVALIDCLSTEQDDVRNLPKIVWVLLILIFSPIGGIAWFIAGRPPRRPVGAAGQWKPGGGFPERERPRRPTGPDDDPDFLRTVGTPPARPDDELFTAWEADLRRREEELKRREGEQPPG